MTAAAQPAPTAKDIEREQQYRAEVAAVSADAAQAFAEGNAARDAERADDALAAYRRAAELAPRIDHIHRRLCGVLATKRDLDAAVTECELALSLAPQRTFNKSALANVLLVRRHAGDLDRATSLAREAADEVRDDKSVLLVWCQIEFEQHNIVSLATCSERLLQIDPNGREANVYGAIVASGAGDYDEARRLLRKARDGGVPEPVYDSLRRNVDTLEENARTFPISADEALELGLAILAIWFVVFLVLIGVASGLSHATLRRIDPTATNSAGSARERRLRKSYRVVLALAGIFFYLSLPLMVVAVVVAGGGVLVAFEEAGGIPIIVIWLVGAGVVATIGAILRSFFVRADRKQPGTPVDLAAYPKLKELLEEVAAAIGTRAVDKAYLAPGTNIGVIERGSVWRSLRGSRRTERSVILGVGLFDAMKQVQLRAILAHEYGHFQNQDTAGGGFALAVRRSLFGLALRLKKSGVASMCNPVWWFVRIFYRAYLGMSQGASRLQEVLADRWAIRAYGSAAFVSAQRHVATRTIEFAHDLDAIVKETVANNWSLPNLYEIVPESQLSESELGSLVEKAIKRAPTLYDSHPSTQQRIEWAEQLAVNREPHTDDDRPVWELFPDPERIERAMTAVVRDELARTRGFLISGTDDKATGAGDDSHASATTGSST